MPNDITVCCVCRSNSEHFLIQTLTLRVFSCTKHARPWRQWCFSVVTFTQCSCGIEGFFFFRPVTSSLSSSSSKFLRTHCSPWQDVPSFWLKALWKSPCWCKQNKTTTVLCLSNCVVFGIFCWFRIRNWKDLFLQQGASSKVSKDAI